MIVSFPLDEDPNVSLIAWTTTPWTLPSNLAVCLNGDMDYVKIVHKKDDKVLNTNYVHVLTLNIV